MMKSPFKHIVLLLFFLVLVLNSSHEAAAQKKKRRSRQEPSPSELREADDYFADGMKYDLIEDYEKASPLIESAYRLCPQNAAFAYKLADVKAKIGKTGDAISYAEQAVDLDDQNKYYYLLLAQLHEKQGQYDDAVRVYQQLIKNVPNADEYHFQLANAYLYEDKFDDALKVYDKIQKRYGFNDEVSRQKQQIYLRMNKLPEAIAEARILAQNSPDNTTNLVMLAEMLIANDRSQDAVPLLENALQQDSSNSSVRLILAESYRAQGKQEAAETQLRKAFASPQVNIDSKIRILASYANNLTGFANEKEKKTAFELAHITLNTHPDDPRSYAVMGDLYNNAGMPNEARDAYVKSSHYDNSKFQLWQQIILLDLSLNQMDSLARHTEQATELFPNQALFWFYNGSANYTSRNYAKAVTALEQGRMLSASNPVMLAQINAQLGDAYNALKEYKKSDVAYDAALDNDSENAHVLNNYSYYLSLRRERLDVARKMSERLVKRNPENATYLDTYGWVLYTLKDYAEARKYLEKAAEKTKNGEVVEHLGDALYKLGEVDAAVEQWKKAQTMGGAVSPHLEKKIATRKGLE